MVRVGSQVAIETDASRAGWGAFCQGEATGGCWSREEQLFHINVLERLAVFLCPESVLKECGRGFCSNTVRQYVCGVPDPEAVATDVFFPCPRSRGGSNRCVFPELGNSVWICTPTMVSNCKVTDESVGGRSDSGWSLHYGKPSRGSR